MKKYQNSTQNINISVEYFNNDNFKSINSLKKIDLNKYYKLLKPHVTLKVTKVFKKITFNKMPVKTGFDFFINYMEDLILVILRLYLLYFYPILLYNLNILFYI